MTEELKNTIELSIVRYGDVYLSKNIHFPLIKMIKEFTYEKLTDTTIFKAVEEWYNTMDNTPENKIRREKLMYIYGHISKWDTSKVTSMHKLFWCKRRFNDDISEWNVKNVIWMEYMFSFVDNVDQSIQNWDYNKHVNTKNMFWNSGKVEYLNEINENINKARFKPDKKYNRYTRVTHY